MPWNDHVDAAVAVFLAGEATGLGIADVLFGKVNPGAKSPATRTDVIVTLVRSFFVSHVYHL